MCIIIRYNNMFYIIGSYPENLTITVRLDGYLNSCQTLPNIHPVYTEPGPMLYYTARTPSQSRRNARARIDNNIT